MYEGDDFYYVRANSWVIEESTVWKFSNKYPEFKDFSTKEAANQYIYLNKPVFSRQSVMNVLREISKGTHEVSCNIKDCVLLKALYEKT